MLRNTFYYGIKPLVPAPIRWSVRRWFARRKRPGVGDIWPVLPGSERPPEGWPGWPDGRKFAFVLTHDVETQAGLDKCRQLMELEMKLGFRSSFNLIPEGPYRVTPEFRADLVRHGFEVGVQDLHHDGKLYRSRKSFARKAVTINQYLKQWGAQGFRAGFMFHNLNWLHDLELGYDASTFDTDPFEPQPDGVGTIFPFWKETGDGRGYAELPYTLPQDSTLFLLFGESTPEIWRRKLDWIARHGGMALMDVHPDYLRFPGQPAAPYTFPAEMYEQILRYVKSIESEAWHCLPREMAAFVRSHRLPKARPPKRVCLVSYSQYQTDARVTRYAEALAKRGDHVEVLCLQRRNNMPKIENCDGVNVIRLQHRVEKSETTPLSYLWPTLRFLMVSTLWIARHHRRRPYDVLHIHNIPDFLVFAGVYPRWRGARVILDIHDIVPEFYGSKFNCGPRSPAILLLRWIERLSANRADHIIMSNHLWLERYAKRTGANGRCSVFINNVDRNIFRPRPRRPHDGKHIMIFPGGLQWHQGLDIALRAFKKAAPRLPGTEFHIYGDGNMKQGLKDLAAELGLNGSVLFFDPLPVRDIAQVMADADLGVVPKRADSFGDEAYSTKIMEFMSLGVPVIVSATKIDRHYFTDSIVRFFKSGDEDALALAMVELMRDEDLRRNMALRAAEYAEVNSWDRRKPDYLYLLDGLCARGPGIQSSSSHAS